MGLACTKSSESKGNARADSAPDYLFKIVFVGDVDVGKSSVILRYTENEFSSQPVATLGEEFKIKFVQSGKHTVKLQIWDTAGTERYRQITVSYYRGASACVVVFDVTNMQSFQHVSNWVQDVQSFAKQGIKFFLIGNKTDLNSARIVPKEDAEALASQLGCSYYETSAKDNIGVTEAMEAITAELLQGVE